MRGGRGSSTGAATLARADINRVQTSARWRRHGVSDAGVREMARRAQIGMMLAAVFGGRRDRSATR